MKTSPLARGGYPPRGYCVTRRRGPARHGVVMAEFILVFPILLLAIIGIIELGRGVMVQQIITNAAREGARRAVVPETTNDAVIALVDNYLVSTGLGAETRQVELFDENGQPIDLSVTAPHSVVMVRVSVPYNEVGFGIYSYLADSTMAAVVQMRTE